MGAEPPAAGGHWGSGGEAQPPEDGSLEQSLQRQGGLEAEAQPLGDFCNFSIKIPVTQFYAYFGQNSYFKVITHQLKGIQISLNVLHRINKVQDL